MGIPGPTTVAPATHPAADLFGISHDDPSYVAGEVTEAVVEVAIDGVEIARGAVRGARFIKAAKDAGDLKALFGKLLPKKAAEPTGNFCSFSASTLVLMSDSCTKPIADIRSGDEVKSADPEVSGGTAEGNRTVIATWVRTDADLVTLTVRSGSGNEFTINTTAEQPFWDATESS